MTEYPAVHRDESLEDCPDCGHDLWLHASGDLSTAQHCRAVTDEYRLEGCGRYGGDVTQTHRCHCTHVIDRELVKA